MVSPAAASQMVNRLEKQNLVQRITDPTDRRVRNVALSEQGEHFVEESIKVRQNWVKNIPDNLSQEQLDQIAVALELLTSMH